MSLITNNNPPNPANAPSPTKLISPAKLCQWKVRVLDNDEIDPTPSPKTWEKIKSLGLKGDVIYRFKHDKTGRRYFGSVKATEKGNTVKKRLGTYKSRINSEGKNRLMHIEYAIRRSPSKFDISIVQKAKEGISEAALHQHEENWMDKFDTLNKKHGYNHSRPTEERMRCSKSKDKSPTIPTRTLPSRQSAINASASIRRQLFTDDESGSDATA
jgi:hypothetical protein